MNGLTNSELEKFCKKLLGKTFLGVFPCDSYPKNITKYKSNISFIFNLSPHYQSGSHFIAVLKKKNKFIYFDSFGKPCKNKLILNFLHNFTTEMTYSNKQIQSKKSLFCGLFCLAFLKICHKNSKTLSYFLNKFSFPLYKNDKLCLNVILK